MASDRKQVVKALPDKNASSSLASCWATAVHARYRKACPKCSGIEWHSGIARSSFHSHAARSAPDFVRATLLESCWTADTLLLHVVLCLHPRLERHLGSEVDSDCHYRRGDCWLTLAAVKKARCNVEKITILEACMA